MAPRQKPGRSEQEVRTPPEFLTAVKCLLGTKGFGIDLAASKENATAPSYFTEDDDSLNIDWAGYIGISAWAWLNPPYAHIEPWVKKAAKERRHLSNYAGIAMLVPASTGANWWRDYVDRTAHVLLLNGRLTFVGHTAPYPKDCALLLYSLQHPPSYEVWSWAKG